MKVSYEHEELPTKIIEALTLLDQKGTNEIVTQAISIVYEAYKRSSANLQFSAKDLLMPIYD
jgi:hypothetical protein